MRVWANPRYFTGIFPYSEEQPVLNIPDLDELAMQGKDKTHAGNFFSPQVVMTDDDHHLIARAAQYLFSSLLLISSRPDLVTNGALKKRLERRGVKQEYWTPNILGEFYKLPKVPLGGTHASPRLHWVRGFWRNQAYGPNSSLRKHIWIEPFLKGADSELTNEAK